MRRVPMHNPEILWRQEPAEREAILKALEAGEEVSDKGWVLLVEGGCMHELNLMAGEIWCLVDGVRDTETLARELAARYEAPQAEILADVEAFVDDCLDKGWLRVRNP